jgi:hypothetical protein
VSALPRSAHPGGPKSETPRTNAHARRGVATFKLAYGAIFGKAVTKITDARNTSSALTTYLSERGQPHLRWTGPASHQPMATSSMSGASDSSL